MPPSPPPSDGLSASSSGNAAASDRKGHQSIIAASGIFTAATTKSSTQTDIPSRCYYAISGPQALLRQSLRCAIVRRLADLRRPSPVHLRPDRPVHVRLGRRSSAPAQPSRSVQAVGHDRRVVAQLRSSARTDAPRRAGACRRVPRQGLAGAAIAAPDRRSVRLVRALWPVHAKINPAREVASGCGG